MERKPFQLMDDAEELLYKAKPTQADLLRAQALIDLAHARMLGRGRA